MAWRRILTLASALSLLLGCTTPVRVSTHAAAGQRAVIKLAIVELSPGPRLAPELRREATQLVTAKVLEAFSLYAELEIIPPDATAHVTASSPAEQRRALREAFGVDAVLSGEVLRYRPREGSAEGAFRPAAVSFTLELMSPDGARLWTGAYDEIQRSLGEDIGSYRRASERGFRWVTAESLSAYGARELVRRFPWARR